MLKLWQEDKYNSVQYKKEIKFMKSARILAIFALVIMLAISLTACSFNFIGGSNQGGTNNGGTENPPLEKTKYTVSFDLPVVREVLRFIHIVHIVQRDTMQIAVHIGYYAV